MTPTLVQSAYRSIAKGDSRTCKVTFESPTIAGNLIVVVAVAGGGIHTHMTTREDFDRVHSVGTPNLNMTAWYEEDCEERHSVTVRVPKDRSLQVRAFEFTGVHQNNALDVVESKVAPHRHKGREIDTGTTGTLDDAGSLILSFVCNTNASTSQSGFAGGLTRLYENTSPSDDSDEDRTRMSVHSTIAETTSSRRLRADLSAIREWIAFIIAFRPGTTGPARLVSRNAPPALRVGDDECPLSCFGRMSTHNAPPALSVGGRGAIGIFDYQYRLNGYLIGDGRDIDVISIDGLEGWTMRTSDADQPRADGAQRGVDLQSARQISMVVEAAGDDDEVEEKLEALYRAISPQRDNDWRLEWRHPGRGVKFVNCRPVDVVRELDYNGTLLARQPIQLRAADPRHYSQVQHSVEILVTPDGTNELTLTSVVNEGNSRAYPTIRVEGPTSGDTVTRVEVGNFTTNVVFVVEASLPEESVLIGDMPARATGSSRAVVTLDGQSRYGAWTQPRDAFYLAADPIATAGVNAIYLRTVPAGAPVRCFLDYYDTWSG